MLSDLQELVSSFLETQDHSLLQQCVFSCRYWFTMAMDCEHTCRVRFLLFDELKLIPLILGSDPLLSQQPGDKNYLTVSGHFSSAERKYRTSLQVSPRLSRGTEIRTKTTSWTMMIWIRNMSEKICGSNNLREHFFKWKLSKSLTQAWSKYWDG